MGKAGTDFDTQTLLGHHVLVGRSSALTYARDTQAAPVRRFEALLNDVRKGVFLPDSTRSGRFVAEVAAGPPGQPEGTELGVGRDEGPASVASEPDLQSAFAFPPSPPLQLDDCFAPLPVPGFSEQAEHGSKGDEDEVWLGEQEWYAEAVTGDLELESGVDLDLEATVGGDGCEPGGSESSSSSDSSSSESTDERVQASGERAGELEHRRLNECLLYRHKTTRTVHLLPAGASSGRFVCGREWSQATFFF